MSKKLTSKECVNVYCNVHQVNLSSVQREALANLLQEIGYSEYSRGVLEMAKFRQVSYVCIGTLKRFTRHSVVCPERHEAARALSIVNEILEG